MHVPFFPQEQYQCGPAALAAMLVYGGVEVTPETLVPQLFIPEKKGTLQVELAAAVRGHGRLPYILDGELEALLEELRAGRPVLVLLDIGVAFWKAYHYAVIVGFDDDGLVLRSGTRRRLAVPYGGFLARWHGGGNWAMTVLQPGQFPKRCDLGRYLETVAALESAGQPMAASLFYRRMLDRFPACDDCLFGLANTELQMGRGEEAIVLYRQLLSRSPSHVGAVNNLAEALARNGNAEQGLVLLRDCLNRAGSLGVLERELLEDTEQELSQRVRQ